MQRVLMLSATIAVMAWNASAFADSPKLKGNYAFTGDATCLVAGAFTPPPTFIATTNAAIQSFAAEGIRTFNGDGTGTATGTSMGVERRFAGPPPFFANAFASTFTFQFTYSVNGDTWTSDVVPGTFQGMVTAGPRTGQTFIITNFPTVTGHISQNAMTLTAATLTPTAETVTYSPPDVPTPVEERICHRSRTLIYVSQ